MQPPGSPVRAVRSNRGLVASLLAFAGLLAAAAGMAGCSRAATPKPAASSAASAKVVKCGTTKTAASVPVNVEIVAGHATCATALAIEASYADAIRSGRAPGNGGGGPVKVKGWTCQGFDTPVVLSTGKASKCVKAGTEILEILPPSSTG